MSLLFISVYPFYLGTTLKNNEPLDGALESNCLDAIILIKYDLMNATAIFCVLIRAGAIKLVLRSIMRFLIPLCGLYGL